MNSDFKIQIPITRGYKDANGDLMLEGVASSDSIDTFETVFNANCQEGFRLDILSGMDNLEPVELESEHNGDIEPMNLLGPVVSAIVTEDNKLVITARLDKENPKAVYYYNKITIPDPVTKKVKQFGLSINGTVKDSHFEYREDLRKNIRVFDRVNLRRIGIVRKPSNPDTWVEKLIRSVQWENIMETTTQVDTINTVKRVEWYDSTQILGTMQSTIDAMSALESWIQSEEYENLLEGEDSPEKKIGEDALTLMSQALNKLQAVLAYESAPESETNNMENREATTENTTVKEDLDDKVETVTKGEIESNNPALETEVPAFIAENGIGTKADEQLVPDVIVPNPELPAEVATERSEVATVTVDVSTAAMDAVVEAVGTILRETIDALTAKFDKFSTDSQESFELVGRKLEDAEKTNKELVERLARVEGQPASKPGVQLVDGNVVRAENPDTVKRAENFKLAQEKRDIQEMLKFKIHKEYLGNGEFAQA